MAQISYEANFAAVLPTMRARARIVADLDDASRLGTLPRARLAEIELAIRNGDDLLRRGQEAAALVKFREARAQIYKILHPGLDFGMLVSVRADAMLPLGPSVERMLFDASAVALDTLRPPSIPNEPMFAFDGTREDKLESFMRTGYREALGTEESLQRANEHALSSMSEGKTLAAAQLLDQALSIGLKTRGTAPGIVASTALNLAAARLDAGEAGEAAKAAEIAQDYFTRAKDTVGLAQAQHSAGVAMAQQGDAAGSQRLLAQAAATLKREPSGVRRSAVAGVTSRGTVPTSRSAMVHLAPTAALSRQTAGILVDGLILRPDTLALPTSRDTSDLTPIAEMSTKAYTYRLAGRGESWGSADLIDAGARRQLDKSWVIGVPVGGGVVAVPTQPGRGPRADDVMQSVYAHRPAAAFARELNIHIADTSTVAAYLTHLYAYALPVKIGDCQRSLGQHAEAETSYLQAASYSWINRTIEATALWTRMARNIQAWGDAMYKAGRLDDARAQYSKLVTPLGQPAASYFYQTAALQVPADAARTLLAGLEARPLPVVNWEITLPLLGVWERLQQLADGLDFYGLALSPIHTFEYLQNVARAFTQEAMQAESEFINFKSHQELEEAGRRDLETASAMAEAEVQGRYQLWQSALDDVQAAARARDLAQRRRDDAVTQRNAYANSSLAQIWAQASASALGGGEDAYWSEISELADKLDRGETIHGPGPKLAAAQVLSAGRKTRAYELQKMDSTIAELTAAIAVAVEQLQSAERRAGAAEIAYQAAQQRADLADASLEAFENEFFTPESWAHMADVMRDIAKSFLYRAIRIARLMERAYNFENDTTLAVIKNEYGFAVANAQAGQDTRLLGGQRLLLDIESFTYSAITTKTRKSSRIKDVLSVAASYPAQFGAFRDTGLLSIETDLYEFDRLHPGFYGQRIEAVEVAIVGLLPDGSTGLNGTLTAGGITSFRQRNGNTSTRAHLVDTMALSDFQIRNDVFLYTAETGVRGLFQGIGLGSTWELHLPKRSNDIDFRRIFDIQFIFYYTARFDPALRTAVLALPPRPGEMTLQRNFGLRYDFPDAWYAYYQGGVCDFTLQRARLPMNQQAFTVQSVMLRVETRPGVSPEGLTLRLSVPAGDQAQAVTDANGVVAFENGPITGATPVGPWRVEVLGGVPLQDDGQLRHDRVYNIHFGLEYGFEAVPEVL